MDPLLVLAGLLSAMLTVSAAEPPKAGGQTAEGPFKPDWPSLHAHQDPEWFRDAKFGTYTHWGPVTVGCEDGSISPGLRRGAELMQTGLAIRLPEPYTLDEVIEMRAFDPGDAWFRHGKRPVRLLGPKARSLAVTTGVHHALGPDVECAAVPSLVEVPCEGSARTNGAGNRREAPIRPAPATIFLSHHRRVHRFVIWPELVTQEGRAGQAVKSRFKTPPLPCL